MKISKIYLQLLIISAFLFLNFSCQKDKNPPHSIINLGETEWKFTKTKPGNLLNLALNANITLTGKDFPAIFNVDLGRECQLYLFRGLVNDTSADWINYKVEASNTGKEDWVLLADRSWDNESPRAFQITNLSESRNLPLTSEKMQGECVEAYLSGKFRYLKISVFNIESSEKKKLPGAMNKFEIWGSEDNMDWEMDFKNVEFDDNNWQSVGIPHCFNDNDTYLNASQTFMWRGTCWYRKHFILEKKYEGQKVFLEFQGINVGAAVYINGKFKPQQKTVSQPSEVTHVGGFLPFAIDITDEVLFGKENMIAVRVSNAPNSFFIWPGFGVYEGFGMGWGGIVCPVYLHLTNKIYIPLDVTSDKDLLGTYVSTVSADSTLAKVSINTQVVNETTTSKKVKLITTILDKANTIVFQRDDSKQVEAFQTAVFDQIAYIDKPQLWYPNNSPYGIPYLYKVKHEVEVNGKLVDIRINSLGIRTIKWDKDFCYVNGKKHFLQGFGHRNLYPALGSAIPEELQWKDIKLIADAGGNCLRVGHVPATKVMVEACDAYGIMVIQNSGDNEWSLKNEPALTYKSEYDREMIIAFRNHPSISVWESNNGLAKDGTIYSAQKTYNWVKKLDFIQPRIVESRDTSDFWPENDVIMIGYTNRYTKVEGSPSVNMEVYGARWDGKPSWNIGRFDYENEKTFSDWFVNNYLSDIENHACGWVDWMLAETQGEAYTIYLNGKFKQKSLGSSAMDGNRFPKLKYNIYKYALWNRYSDKPGVVLQSSWNLSGTQTVNTWSNCPLVELFLNGKSLGIKTPDSKSKICSWENITWETGELKAVGLDEKGKEKCSDTRVTSMAPHHIELKLEPNLVKPDGEKFSLKANGTDVAIITAKVVDKDGNLCPDADQTIQFSVEGNGIYRGSYNFYVDRSKPIQYHVPGDQSLQAEGGLMRIAVQSTFMPGKVEVHASSAGMQEAKLEFEFIN
ncbi:MAG: DUF4982 domain-containing protein [Bacteroidales bacterium]